MGIMDRTNDARREAKRAGGRARRRISGERSGPGWLGAGLIGLVGGAFGAIVAFLTDPARGRARRSRLLDQGAAAARRFGRTAERAAHAVGSTASGKMEAMRQAGASLSPTDDVTVRDRAETELFRDPSVPKGAINLNVERGVLVLRGEVPDSAMRERLGQQAERIDGVWSVRNLLHLPGEPAGEELIGSASG